MSNDNEKIELFKKLIISNSCYTKLCSDAEIDVFKYYYSKISSRKKYLKTNDDYLTSVLNFYKQYNTQYYEILITNINKNIIMSSNKIRTISDIKTGKSFIKINNNDSDLFRLVHEFAHFIDFKLHKDIINSNAYYAFFPEIFSFCMEKQFIKLVGSKYENIVKIRQNNHYLAMQEKLSNLLIMQEYERYYLKYGHVPNNIEIEKAQKILDLKSQNVINNILGYLIGDIVSDYLIENNIKLKEDFYPYVASNYHQIIKKLDLNKVS